MKYREKGISSLLQNCSMSHWNQWIRTPRILFHSILSSCSIGFTRLFFSTKHKPSPDHTPRNFEANLAKYYCSTSIRNRILHDYASQSDPEPLHIPLNRDEIREKLPVMEEDLINSVVLGNLSLHDEILLFDANFESGNLLSAKKIGAHEYELHLTPDIGTENWVQWFYFSVRGMKKGVTYKFNITNFYKVDSLFNYGLKPLLYIEGKGWRRAGENISYYANDANDETNHRYTATWTFTPTEDIERCYWAHSYPYTYSDLQDYLSEIDAKNLDYFSREVLCYSLAKNRIELLTITNPTESKSKMNMKEGVIISARVHPGESNASWMMKGVIDFLVSNHPEAKYLRERYIFKIIPMLNPDGVIIGNYRCSLSGEDLNRVWTDTDPLSFPEIYNFKKFMQRFSEERNVILFVDFHGHSKKKDAFFFGNSSKNHEQSLHTRIYPFLMSKLTDGMINYDFCTFTMDKIKRSTARIVAYKEMKLDNSFTLEASMCGPNSKDVHYRVVDYEKIGELLCKGLIKYEDKNYVQKLLSELNEMNENEGKTKKDTTSKAAKAKKGIQSNSEL